jgi:hypothetical protein
VEHVVIPKGYQSAYPYDPSDRIVMMPPGFDPQGVSDGLARFAEQVLPKL